MRRKEAVRKISAYLDNELTLSKRLEIENHLRAHAEDTELAEQLKKEAEWLSLTYDGSECSPDLAPAVLEKLKEKPSDETARIILARGRVEYRQTEKDDWKPLNSDNPVYPGEQVRTGTDGRAFLLLEDGSEIWVYKDTHLKFPKYIKDKRWFQIFSGEFLAFFHKQREPFHIATPAGRVEVVGTEFDITVPDENTAVVSVIKGVVRLVGDLGEQMVYRASQLKAKKGVAPGKTMPIRPEAIAPWANEFFASAVKGDKKLSKTTKGRLEDVKIGNGGGGGGKKPFFTFAFITLILAVLLGVWQYLIKPEMNSRQAEELNSVVLPVVEGIPVPDADLVAEQKVLVASAASSLKMKDSTSGNTGESDDSIIDLNKLRESFYAEDNVSLKGRELTSAQNKLLKYVNAVKTLQADINMGGFKNSDDVIRFTVFWKDINQYCFEENDASGKEVLIVNGDDSTKIDMTRKYYRERKRDGYAEMICGACIPILFKDFFGGTDIKSVDHDAAGNYYFYDIKINSDKVSKVRSLNKLSKLKMKFNRKVGAIEGMMLTEETEQGGVIVGYSDFRKKGLPVPIAHQSINSQLQGRNLNQHMLIMSNLVVNPTFSDEQFNPDLTGYLERHYPHKDESEYREALLKDPNDVNALFNLSQIRESGLSQIREGGNEEKLELLMRADKLMPDHPEILEGLGNVCFKLKKYEDVVSYIKRLHQKNPTAGVGNMVLIRAWKELGRLEEGYDYFLKLRESAPYEGYLERVNVALVEIHTHMVTESKDIDYIIDGLAKYRREFTDESMIHHAFISGGFDLRIRMYRDEEDKFIKALENGVKKYPGDIILMEALANVYIEEKRNDDAAEIYGQILNLVEPEGEIEKYINKKVSRAGIKMEPRERIDLDEELRNLKGNPGDSPHILKNFLAKLVVAKDYLSIVRFHEMLIGLGDVRILDRWRTAIESNMNRDVRSAYLLQEAYLKKVRKKPYAEFYRAIAYMSAIQLDYDQAVAYLSEAIRRGLPGKETSLLLGNWYLENGDFDKALAAYKKSSLVNIHTYIRAVESMIAAGEKEMALGLCEKLETDMKPPYSRARSLAREYINLGEYDKALKLLERQMSAAKEVNWTFGIDLLSKAMSGSNLYDLPPVYKQNLSRSDQAKLMLKLVEYSMWSRKYRLRQIVYRHETGLTAGGGSLHNFPAAVKFLERMDADGLASELEDTQILDRIRGLLANYTGDYARALEYYQKQAGKKLSENLWHDNKRWGRSIVLDPQFLIDIINGKGLPNSAGTIRGTVNYKGRPIEGITVCVAGGADGGSRGQSGKTAGIRFNYDIEHPAGSMFYPGREVKRGPLVSAITGADGVFTFRNMPPGNYDFIFYLDNALIDPLSPEDENNISGDIKSVSLGEGGILDIGRLDIVSPVRILEPENGAIVYDDTLHVEWECDAPPAGKDYKYEVYVFNIIGLGENDVGDRVVVNQNVKDPFIDIPLADYSRNGDYRVFVHINDGRMLSMVHAGISVPRFYGLTSELNERARKEARNITNLFYADAPELFISRAYRWLEKYPSSTLTDEMLIYIARAYEKLDNKYEAISVYERFLEEYPGNALLAGRDSGRKDWDVIGSYAKLTDDDPAKLRDHYMEAWKNAPREFQEPPGKNQDQAVRTPVYVGQPLKTSAADRMIPWTILLLVFLSAVSFIQGRMRR